MIAISYAVRDFIVRSGEISDKQMKKLEIVYYGIDLRNNGVRRRAFERKPILVVGTIGRLVPQKDIATLIRACASFNQEFSGKLRVETRIVGSGILSADLHNLARDLGTEHDLLWIESLDDVGQFLRGIDVFVLSSLYEGFGMVLLEAMEENVPILATRTTSIPEVMGIGYKGLFEVANFQELSMQLARCFEPEYRRYLTRNYAERLEEFGASKTYNKLNSLYAEIVSRD